MAAVSVLKRENTYNLMLLTVLVRHGLPVGKLLFKGRVYNQFLAVGVTGQFPCELVLEPGFLANVGRSDNFVIVLLQLAVVLLDRVRNTSHISDL
jgi:hypothetical protein